MWNICAYFTTRFYSTVCCFRGYTINNSSTFFNSFNYSYLFLLDIRIWIPFWDIFFLVLIIRRDENLMLCVMVYVTLILDHCTVSACLFPLLFIVSVLYVNIWLWFQFMSLLIWLDRQTHLLKIFCYYN